MKEWALKLLIVSVLVAGTFLHLAMRIEGTQDTQESEQDRLRIIQPGDQLPDVSFARIGDRSLSRSKPESLLEMADDDACRIVYFFNVNCSACDAGAARWTPLAARALEERVEVWWVGVGSSKTAASTFLNEFGISHPAFVPYDETDGRRLGLYGTPMVWGTVGTEVRFTASGALLTSPDSLRTRLHWCPERGHDQR